MKWSFDNVRGFHYLEDAGAPLAKIYVSRSSKGKERIRVKTLVSFLYFSPARQKRLERTKKEWEVTVRKFDTREDADKYIECKRDEVLRFIRAREN